jgi:hypothetical protein
MDLFLIEVQRANQTSRQLSGTRPFNPPPRGPRGVWWLLRESRSARPHRAPCAAGLDALNATCSRPKHA